MPPANVNKPRRTTARCWLSTARLPQSGVPPRRDWLSPSIKTSSPRRDGGQNIPRGDEFETRSSNEQETNLPAAMRPTDGAGFGAVGAAPAQAEIAKGIGRVEGLASCHRSGRAD